MTDRMKLTLISLTVMMLPYRIGIPVTVLVVTAILSTAIVVMRGRIQVLGKFTAALSLYRSLNLVHYLLNYKSASK